MTDEGKTNPADLGEGAAGLDIASASETVRGDYNKLPVCFTVFKSPEPLSKRFALGECGGMVKTAVVLNSE